jgi:NAD(P)-dependent dehydrogenase (short-subunit alcohol dehydrogenase family)
VSRPVCLITGATDGVGRVTAVELAKRGFHVVIAARSATKAEALTRELEAVTGGRHAEYILADLASLGQVRQLAATFRQRHSTLDVLVNNAGVFLPKRTLTEDGYETSFQVNFLAHFLLTNLLLDELLRSDQGRIVNLSSSVYSSGKFDAGNLQSEKRFSVLGTYAATKLFMLMFTEELAHRLRATKLTANAVHPGIVRTQMMLNAPGAFRIVSYLTLPFSISPEKGATTTVRLASSPELAAVSGHYFTNSKRTETKNAFDTPENRALLWDLSVRLAESGSTMTVRRAV